MFYDLVRRQDFKRPLKGGEMMSSLGKIWLCSRRQGCDMQGTAAAREKQHSPGLEACSTYSGCSRRWEATSPVPAWTERPPGNRRGWAEFAAIYKVTETKTRNTDQFVRA